MVAPHKLEAYYEMGNKVAYDSPGPKLLVNMTIEKIPKDHEVQPYYELKIVMQDENGNYESRYPQADTDKLKQYNPSGTFAKNEHVLYPYKPRFVGRIVEVHHEDTEAPYTVQYWDGINRKQCTEKAKPEQLEFVSKE